MMAVAIVDYGMGNLRSVQKAFERVGAMAVVTSSPDEIRQASHVVLPGVGAFPTGMRHLERLGLIEVLHDVTREGRPLLGICLGLQLLFEESEEFGRHQGLGLLKGRVTRFPSSLSGQTLKVPHMGWNSLEVRRPVSCLEGIPSGAHFYFVHSYYVVPSVPETVVAITRYGLEFVSAVTTGSVFGCQFHPEKSQQMGLRLLENFCRSVPHDGQGPPR